MEMRFLGQSGLQVSSLSFGLMTFGGAGAFQGVGSTQSAEASRLIDIAFEAGVNLLDTADIYSDGLSEQILGEIIGERRKNFVVATKVYGKTGSGSNDLGLSRLHIMNACEASLRRLKTDWIDLYQVHNPDSRTPMEETHRALDDLVRAGKVRYIGCSNYFGWQLTKSVGISERFGLARFISQQIQYSLLERDVETEMLPAGVDQGVGALIWSPLASGYLSGKFRNQTAPAGRLANSGRLSLYDDARGRAVVEGLAEIAAERNVSISQVALNWVRRRPGVSSVIIGARNEAQLVDNLQAGAWNLTDAEALRLDAVSQTKQGYPYGHHERFFPERNPLLFPPPSRSTEAQSDRLQQVS